MEDASCRRSASKSAAMRKRSPCSRQPAPTSRASGGCGCRKGWCARSSRRARRRNSSSTRATRPARSDRRPCHRVFAGLRLAICSRRRPRPPQRHPSRLPEFRKLTYMSPVATSFGRHRLRANRPSCQQAAPRHALCAHDLVGQTVHGIGDDRIARGRLDRNVPASYSGRDLRRPATHCVILGNVNVNSPLVLTARRARVFAPTRRRTRRPLRSVHPGRCDGPVSRRRDWRMLCRGRLLRGARPT